MKLTTPYIIRFLNCCASFLEEGSDMEMTITACNRGGIPRNLRVDTTIHLPFYPVKFELQSRPHVILLCRRAVKPKVLW